MKKLNLNTIATKFKKIYRRNDDSSFYRLGITIILILGLTSFLIQFHTPHLKKVTPIKRETIDTYIPANQRLLTIEVMNYESLDQIIGQYGVVDLYAQPLITGEKARLIMPQVKLMRSSKSPNHFNVLLKPDEVARLASHTGELIASIRNPKFVGTQIVKEKATKRNILFDEGSL